MKKFGRVWLEQRGQGCLVTFHDETGVWSFWLDAHPKTKPPAVSKTTLPLRWSDELHEKVVRWAGWVAGKMRFDDDTRDDLVSECLIKAHRQVSAGKIYTVSALNRLCRNKGLDMLRKRIRITGRECELAETSDGPVGGECTQEERTFTDQVRREFYLLHAAAQVIAEGGSMEDAAERVRMDVAAFKEWFPEEQARARERFGERQEG